MIRRTLYLFNPDHDLALASGEAHYMAPASARQMAADLAILPFWYADPNSVVLAPSAYNLDFVRQMGRLFSSSVGVMTEPEVAGEPGLSLFPWGWNPALKKRLLSLGIEQRQLPSTDEMQAVRLLSHRWQAMKLLSCLQLNEFFCGESFFLASSEEWQSFVEGREVCLLKAPLSGSGKGLNWCRGQFTPFISGWCARIGKQQGGVMGEPVYDKVEDFAMEFRSDREKGVRFAGYSLFTTAAGGAYEGNCLLPDGEIEKRLSAFVPASALQELSHTLERMLSELLSNRYSGYLGVDMMICRFVEPPFYRIHPCVEINLRMSMGMVARLIADRYLASGAEGVFRIAYDASSEEGAKAHRKSSEETPLLLENGRVRSGYLPLTPITPRSRYRAWLSVGGGEL